MAEKRKIVHGELLRLFEQWSSKDLSEEKKDFEPRLIDLILKFAGTYKPIE